jgi:RecA/RadA recombinase
MENLAKDLNNSISLEPEVVLPGIANLAMDFVDNKIIHGNAEDRSEVAGQTVFEIAQFFIGTGEVKATTKAAELGVDAAKTSKAINLTTKATKVIKTEKLLNSTVFKDIKQTLSTTAKNAGYKAIDSIDSMRLLFRNSSPNMVPSYAEIGHLDDFVGTSEIFAVF